MPRIMLGACSWNYDSWQGIVYSSKKRTAAEYLIEYSKKYDTVEIDSWFYKIPTKIEAAVYNENTPKEFSFTCKVTQDITLTHSRSNNRGMPILENGSFLSIDLFDKYCEMIAPLADKIDLIMFEFEYMNRDKMESVDKFIDLFGNFRAKMQMKHQIGIEIRNREYLNDDYFRFLRDTNIVHVFSEKQYMPHVYDVYAKYREYIGDTIVFRLLGNDRAEIEHRTNMSWNSIVEEKVDKNMILDISIDTQFDRRKTIINVNNHYEGSAPLTIESMKRYYREKGVEM